MITDAHSTCGVRHKPLSMADLTRNDHAARDNFTLPYGRAERIGSREQLCVTQNLARILGLVMVT